MNLRLTFYLLITISALMACRQEKSSPQKPVVDIATKTADSAPVQQKQKLNVNPNTTFKDTVEFLEYDDNGDYALIFFNQNKQRKSYIYQGEEKLGFLRGDQISISWKQDSIWIAGDGDRLEITPCIKKARKITDGSVSRYRKKNPKPIKYWTAEKDGYSKDFKDYLYTWVEYYLANTKNDLVKLSLKANDDLIYSIEDTQKKGRAYTMLGLSKEVGGQSNILVWLYLDNETRKFYEHDLANDKLVEFK